MSDPIVVVDLSAKFWSAYMSRKDGDPVSAPHDWTVGFVRRLADDHKHVAIACDAKKNFRKEIFPGYKAQRLEREPAAWAQLEHTAETLKREGFTLWHAEGFEADDIIATVVHQATRAEQPRAVLVVSFDKDLMQLVRDSEPWVRQLTLGGPNAPPRTITEATCSIGKKSDGSPLLVPPRLVRDFLALTGDGSDNIPGVRGIGPTKAMGLLDAYKSFPGVIAALEANDPRLMSSASGKALAEHKADAVMSWQLVELRTDVPIDWTEALRKRVPLGVPSPMRDDVADGEFEEEQETNMAPSNTVTVSADGNLLPREALASIEQAMRGASDDKPMQATSLAPWTMQLEPSNSGGAIKLATYLADSQFFPALVTPEKCLAAILLGRVHGIPAVVSCMNCTPIKGRMSMSSGMLIGIVQKADVCEYIEGVDGDETFATWVAKRKGRPEREHTFRWADAVKAGYTAVQPGKGPGSWQKDPAHMLWIRCGTRIARRVFPDVIAGVYATEELEGDS